jgi:DNA-binding response OmpR family regulator
LSIVRNDGDAIKSILIVDDDEASLTLMEHFLTHAGYKVTSAGDGIDALLALGQQRFDLIISDINMPHLDGFKLLEMLAQKGLQAPVIMVTGSTGAEDEIKGLELGAQDYIRKPLNKEALLFRVRKALGEHRSQLGAA